MGTPVANILPLSDAWHLLGRKRCQQGRSGLMSEEDRVAGIFYSSVLKTGSNKNVPEGSMEREAAVL